MPNNTTDQQITLPIGTDAADNPVAFIDSIADVEPRLVRSYVNLADRTARMAALSENDFSTLTSEERAEIYDGTNHISLFTRSLYSLKFRTADAAAINNSTALVSDAVLFAPLPIAGRFHWDLTLFFDSSTTADFKVAHTIPAGATMKWGGIGPSVGVSGNVGSGQFLVVTASGASVAYGGSGVGAANTSIINIRGSVLMGGTAGNLQVQYAQQTLDATNTVVRADSRLMVWRAA